MRVFSSHGRCCFFGGINSEPDAKRVLLGAKRVVGAGWSVLLAFELSSCECSFERKGEESVMQMRWWYGLRFDLIAQQRAKKNPSLTASDRTY